jgi:multiple sugar transport system substrate-binding protein
MNPRANRTLNRRSLIKAATAGAAATLVGAPSATRAASPGPVAAPTFLRHQEVDSLTLVINSSPWMAGYQHMAETWTEQSGIEIEFAAFPFDEVFGKERNAVLNETDEFDLFTLGESWVAFFYAGGYVRPIHELDPDFAFDPEVFQYNNLSRWNAETRYFSDDGEIVGVPQCGINQLLFYRRDLYEENGLALPETWDDARAAAEALGTDDFYGYVNRGAKGDPIAWDWLAHYMGRTDGEVDYLGNPPENWNPELNNDAGLEALEYYIELSQFAPPNVGDINQADQINLMAGDKALQTVAASSAQSAMDNEQESAVPGLVDYAVVPMPAGGRHATMSGVFALSIPKHIAQERQEAAYEFMKWSMTADAQISFLVGGGIPVRSDAYSSEEAEDPKYRFGQAMAGSSEFVHPFFRLPEGPELRDRLGLRLNEALIGDLEPQEALATAETEMREILVNAGYPVE